MKLKRVTIHKYKSIETDQTFDVDDTVTVLVGMNEAGKTSVLEAIAKVRYFQSDKVFKFNATHDYPRREKKKFDKAGIDSPAVTLTYAVDSILLAKIAAELGPNVFTAREVTYSRKYSNGGTFGGVQADRELFFAHKLSKLGLEDSVVAAIKAANTTEAFKMAIAGLEGNSAKIVSSMSPIFENKWDWDNDCISEFVARNYLSTNMPKFLYYDEYYALPSEVVLEDIIKNNILENEEFKTAKALFELSDIDIGELIKSDDFEDYIAELEATQALITKELFEYWTSNKNLKIRFAIDKKVAKGQNPLGQQVDHITQHVLNIRVENTRTDMTLPLKNRSKGFNWFFSFLVWFKKIQEDAGSKYILLLDEPGLNLHATAQADLLRFFENLGANYQIIYTTHSPFMIDTLRLHSVRTVVDTDAGTKISDSIQEKDPRTLFPLQAALGYNVAQNLFIAKNNLLVEGVSDLIYMNVISDLLKSTSRVGLKDDVTIVPVGGLDKVSTFISLLGANKLNMVCLLDTFTDQKGKARLDDMVRGNNIKQKSVKFFDEYVASDRADIEDMFEKSEYISLFNEAFDGEHKIDVGDLDSKIPQITAQIAKFLGVNRYNHYRPAKLLASKGVGADFFASETLDRFEAMFKDVNKGF